MKILLAGVLLAYALLAHGALLGIDPGLTPMALWLLPVAMLMVAWNARKPVWLVPASLLALLVWALQRADAGALLLFLPPILAHGLIASMFASTLLPGSEPLIIRFIRIVHGPDNPPDTRLCAYARLVTTLWAGLFVLLCVVEVGLLLLVVPEGLLAVMGVDSSRFGLTSAHFAWFAHVGSWLLMALLMGVEWTVRKRRFPDMPYRNFAHFIRRLIEVGPQVARQWRHE
ncbi:MAG: hypothetical protein IPK97_07165 [Ahniella sp.]|nr:hypothetical protein [Ahniella sp.]